MKSAPCPAPMKPPSTGARQKPPDPIARILAGFFVICLGGLDFQYEKKTKKSFQNIFQNIFEEEWMLKFTGNLWIVLFR